MIITNALIYTCDDGNTVIKDGYIRIADGKIIETGSMRLLMQRADQSIRAL